MDTEPPRRRTRKDVLHEKLHALICKRVAPYNGATLTGTFVELVDSDLTAAQLAALLVVAELLTEGRGS